MSSNREIIHGLTGLLHRVAHGILHRKPDPELARLSQHLVLHAHNNIHHRVGQLYNRDNNLAVHVNNLAHHLNTDSDAHSKANLWSLIRASPNLTVHDGDRRIYQGAKGGGIHLNLERLVGAIGAHKQFNLARKYVDRSKIIERQLVDPIRRHASQYTTYQVPYFHWLVHSGHRSLDTLNPYLSRVQVDPEGGELDTGTRGIRKLLDRHRGWHVNRWRIGRSELPGQGFLHAIAGDTKNTDKYFHTYNTLEIVDPSTGAKKLIRYHKNENTQVHYKLGQYDDPIPSDRQEIEVTNFKPMPLSEFIGKGITQQAMNGRDINNYSISNDNCQYFVRDHLDAHGVSTPELEKFSFQNASDIIRTGGMLDNLSRGLTWSKRQLNYLHDSLNDAKNYAVSKWSSIKNIFTRPNSVTVPAITNAVDPLVANSKMLSVNIPNGTAITPEMVAEQKIEKAKIWLDDHLESNGPQLLGQIGIRRADTLIGDEGELHQHSLDTTHLVDHGFTPIHPVIDKHPDTIINNASLPFGINSEQQIAISHGMPGTNMVVYC